MSRIVLPVVILLNFSVAFSQGALRLGELKQEAVQAVEEMRDFTQQVVDMIFSYGELGFQETETSRYVVDILRKNGFEVKEGISGMPGSLGFR